nr:hypothetical protein [Aeromicrobium sp.]
MTDQTPVPPPPPPPPATAPPVPTAAAPAGPPPPPPPAPPTADGSRGRGGNTGKKVVVGVIAAAIILGGGYGAYAVYDKLDGGGPQPHDVLPASTDAYLRLDLDPSAGQKVDLFQLIQEFPEVAEEIGLKDEDQDIRELVFGQILASECDDVDYDKDVEPWLGDRVGVGFEVEDERFVIAVQTTDEGKSREGIKKLFACSDDTYGIAYLDGYAILAPEQSDVDGAVSAAKKSTLGDEKDFTQDFEQLGNQGVASGWVDLKAIAKIPELADAAGEQAAELAKAGTVATTLRVDGSTLELAVLGGPEQKGKKVTALTKLPADTVAALSVSGGGDAVTENFEQLTEELDGLGGMTGLTSPPAIDTPPAAVTPVEPVDPVAPVDPDGTPRPDDLGGLPDDFPFDTTPDDSTAQGFIDEFEQATGLQLPEDLATLFGDNLTLAIGAANLEKIPTLSGPEGLSGLDIALSLTSDKTAALDLVERIAQLGTDAGLTLVTAPTDDGAVLATNQDAADAIADPQGELGDEDVFKSVIPGGDDTYGGFYLNIGAILDKLLQADPPKDVREFIDEAKALSAVGVSVSEKDGRTMTSLRIAFDTDE